MGRSLVTPSAIARRTATVRAGPGPGPAESGRPCPIENAGPWCYSPPVTERADDTRARLSLEEVAQAVQDLSTERTLDGFVVRFLEDLRRWAAPSAVLAAVRDPTAESGWRLLPALCAGSGPLGAERSVRQLVEDVPQDLPRPSLVRPGGEMPGVRVRENCVVPWSCEGESGVLMLRGVVDPAPPNLAEAVALLSAPVWPRLLGGPAARVEASVTELRRLADRLREDADRQVERLQAARPPVEEPPAPDPVAATRLTELEQELTSTRAEAARLSALVESLRSEGAGAAGRLEEERQAARQSRAAAQAAEGALASARKELANASEGTERLSALVESLQSESARTAARLEEERQAAQQARAAAQSAEGALASARKELANGAQGAARLSALVESLQSESARTAARLEEERQAAEQARAAAQSAEGALASARRELADGAQSAARLSALVESLQSESARTAARLEEERQTAGQARAAVQSAEEGLAAARKEVADAEDSVARHILEREELRQQVTTLEKALGEAEEERDEIRSEANRLAHKLEAARAAGAGGEMTGRTAEPPPGSSETVEVFRRAMTVLRRTPFLPPSLRVAMQEAEAAVGDRVERPARFLRVAVLDRDTAGLEPLAAELESAGFDVKIASHPEELALLLKTPQGRELDAAICDVLAFRPDQTVAGIFRGWEKDRPGLALYLSFSRDSPPEVERVQRVPLSLTKGRFQRPLNRADLMEMLEPLRRPTP